MIIAKRNDQFFLAAFASHLRGCNLSSPDKPKIESEKFHLLDGRFWVWSHAPLVGTRFFPKAYWHGTPVWITAWCVHTPDARVQCEVMANEINQEAWFGRRYKSSLEWAPLARELGWGYDFNDMIATRYCTIDELDLVEGPPPEGPF